MPVKRKKKAKPKKNPIRGRGVKTDKAMSIAKTGVKVLGGLGLAFGAYHGLRAGIDISHHIQQDRNRPYNF